MAVTLVNVALGKPANKTASNQSSVRARPMAYDLFRVDRENRGVVAAAKD
jgi:hypothetical protein